MAHNVDDNSRNKVENSGLPYKDKAAEAKERIWDKIEFDDAKKINYTWISIAASIVVLIGISFYFLNIISKRNGEIENLQAKLSNTQNTEVSKSELITQQKQEIESLKQFILKGNSETKNIEKVVYLPQEIKEVVKTEYLRDTVVIEKEAEPIYITEHKVDTIYSAPVSNQLNASDDYLTEADETKLLFMNHMSKSENQPNERKKFRFKNLEYDNDKKKLINLKVNI